LKLAGTGIALGLALAAIAAKLIASLLYGIGAFDLVTFVVVPAVFLATAVMATVLPARRAAGTHPSGSCGTNRGF
jgi:putative ABC transport system permease protein